MKQQKRMRDNAMNVYDFDKTIYRGDSTMDFWRYCLKRYPKAVLAGLLQPGAV